jgi:hypothetical protein
LKRPAPIGIVRQMFPLLASKQSRLQDVLSAKWALDRVKLRLAMHALRTADAAVREQQFAALSAALQDSAEPSRWCLLQRAIGRVAANPMVATLLWGVVAYDVRTGPPDLAWASIEPELRLLEHRIVAAMLTDRSSDAELELRGAQQLISELILRTPH